MSAKKFISIVIAAITFLFLFVTMFFFYIDPMFYYRNTELYRPQYIATERYQMAGLVKNREFDTVFTATSMGRNFYEDYADKRLNAHSFNASLPASTAREQSMVAELALGEKENIKQVIWELNFYSFASEDPEWVMGPPSDFPKYMYDDSKINDIRYLFNSYTLHVLYNNIRNNIQGSEYNREATSIYKFSNVAPPESINRVQTALESTPVYAGIPKSEKAETMLASFNYNVIQLAKRYPNTKFTLFFAPYPVYNHVMAYRSHPDFLKERIKFKEEVYQLVSKYDNIELYDFQDEEKITFNISNYYGDGVHYYEFVNNWIIDYFAIQPPIQSLARYQQKLDKWEKQITDFNPEKLYADNTIKNMYVATNN